MMGHELLKVFVGYVVVTLTLNVVAWLIGGWPGVGIFWLLLVGICGTLSVLARFDRKARKAGVVK